MDAANWIALGAVVVALTSLYVSVRTHLATAAVDIEQRRQMAIHTCAESKLAMEGVALLLETQRNLVKSRLHHAAGIDPDVVAKWEQQIEFALSQVNEGIASFDTVLASLEAMDLKRPGKSVRVEVEQLIGKEKVVQTRMQSLLAKRKWMVEQMQELIEESKE